MGRSPMMGGRARRTDVNQQEIVRALRKWGATVSVTSAIGGGFPDLVVGVSGLNVLLEVKRPHPPSAGALTNDEGRWHAAWQGQVAVVRSPEHAISVCENALAGRTAGA